MSHHDLSIDRCDSDARQASKNTFLGIDRAAAQRARLFEDDWPLAQFAGGERPRQGRRTAGAAGWC